MPDIYVKGKPHEPRSTVSGHYLGMMAAPGGTDNTKVWYRGDEFVKTDEQRQTNWDAFVQEREQHMKTITERETAKQALIAAQADVERLKGGWEKMSATLDRVEKAVAQLIERGAYGAE
jgi:hypothetical protein